MGGVFGQSYVVGWDWAWGLGGAWGAQAASVVGSGGGLGVEVWWGEGWAGKRGRTWREVSIGTWRGLED
ncbi:hypothetical protein Aglo03_14230 [Actinokineospora globicatena]|uniref:Uncharacterized protein n=1 Tax=Actinokineospora globicatena TaxID=103729 RepID=A0A9W6QL71_9PSEU|nr:hypothetical protein Aglo03_14230 [Actinokineospora globicatena]